MKVLLLALFVAAAVAVPAPLDEDTGEPVDLVVNGVAEGEPLDIGDVLGVVVQKHVDGQVASATDILHPLTAKGLAEAAANAPEHPESRNKDSEDAAVFEPVVLPEPPAPEVIPDAVILPEAPAPEVIPGPVVLPEAPAPEVVIPDPVVLPDPPQPEVDLTPAEILPAPAPQLPIGEVFNDGTVQVTVNATPSVLTTVQSWFNMVLNYFNGDVQTTHQIV